MQPSVAKICRWKERAVMKSVLKKVAFRVFKIALILLVAASAFLYLTRAKPVILSAALDDTIRPRNYCIMNPFRDAASEAVAETHLRKLRNGDMNSISSLVGDRQYILEEEKKYPIQSWRIGSRKDSPDSVELMYWVSRGGEYTRGLEEAVYLSLVRRQQGWTLQSYSAIY
jgi:hypothetical protein